MSHRKTTEQFIKEADVIHNKKYDYSKVEYIRAHSEVCIICPEHGEFWQTPNQHLKGYGCSKCGGNYKWTTEEWVREASKKNNYFYTYENTQYINKKTKVNVTCPIHGDFEIIPYDHLCCHGCPKCNGKYHYTTEEWIEKANQVHLNKYDCSKTIYINSKSKVCIICPKHGEFWQIANHHLNGVGCPMCGNVSKLEEKVCKLLNSLNIVNERQKHFQWLGLQSLDFYIPSKNIAIECQGIQHFEEVDHFGGESGLLEIRERDERKRNLCSENNVGLYYINYDDNIEEKLNYIISQIDK
jgi:hypothetical protein